MATTIQISGELQKELSKKKLYDRETYEEVLWNMIEDASELNEETKKELAEARKEIREGKVHSFAEVKKELKL